nr:preprotein translocase subunit SecE [Actinospica robiniae]
MSQTRSNADEEVDGVSDGEEEIEDAVVKQTRAQRKAAKRRAKARRAAGGSSSPRRKRTSPALFVRQIIAELRKVVWPTRSELFTYTSVVVVFVAVIIGLVAAFDFGVTHAVSAVFG